MKLKLTLLLLLSVVSIAVFAQSGILLPGSPIAENVSVERLQRINW
jgi:hypothetical protein